MSNPDPHGDLLHAFDAFAQAFVRDCAVGFEGGAAAGALDIGRLTALAERLADDITAWARAVENLDLAKRASLETATAGRTLVESVFDDVLTSGAMRILAAALDIVSNQGR